MPSVTDGTPRSPKISSYGAARRRRSSSPVGVLHDRDAEVASVQAVLDEAASGAGGVVVVEGSPGVGKSRLLVEGRLMAEDRGMRVLSARGADLEREFAFGLVRQLFDPLVAEATDTQKQELLAGAASVAARLFEPRLDEPDTGALSFAMVHGIYWMAANAAFLRSTVLLVDDLHWGDRPSLRWLCYLSRRLDGLPLTILAATRPPEQSDEPTLLSELLGGPGVVVTRPRPLRLESVELMVREALDAEPDPAFSAACHAVTGGNPLFLHALLATLGDRHVAPTSAAARQVAEVGPEPVGRVVTLRLHQLSPQAEAFSRALAVLGRSGSATLPGSLAGLDPHAAVDAATALARTELLAPGPELEFAHPVVRAAVYESIPAVERAVTHRRAASLLSGCGVEPEHAASHLLRVPPAADPFVCEILRAAARQAAGRGAMAEAGTYLRRVLAEPPAPDDRGPVLAELGIVERSIDLPASVQHLREAVPLTRGTDRFVPVARTCGQVLLFTGLSNDESIGMLRAAIQGAGEEHADLREQATADLISASWLEPGAVPAALQLLGKVQESRLHGGLGSDMLLATMAHHEVRRGIDRARARELATRALASGALERVSAHSLYYALDTLRTTGDVTIALAAYGRALASSRARGDLFNVGGTLSFRGWLRIEQGDLRSAEPDVREGIDFARDHAAPVNVMLCAMILATYLLETGMVGEADTALNELVLPDPLPDQFHFTFFHEVRGRVRLAQRRPRAALAEFQAIRRIAGQLGLENPAAWPWRSMSAAAFHALDRDADARRLANEELELAHRWGAARPIGVALRALGLVEQGRQREARLREAVAVLDQSPARLESAKALVDLGAELRRRNDRRAAREFLRLGADLAQECGADPVLAYADAEIGATGARPRKLRLTGVSALSASERRVATMASEGLSNKEIAQALFVTVKTVEVHLSSTYRKLQVSSRHELPAALGGTRPFAASPG